MHVRGKLEEWIIRA